ncbi:hypothetical protein KY308_03550 [Candidatus Woesearchaeota archaeon]|nr:hypothetical protein [Candidatus Woesearchaeota archaeon]
MKRRQFIKALGAGTAALASEGCSFLIVKPTSNDKALVNRVFDEIVNLSGKAPVTLNGKLYAGITAEDGGVSYKVDAVGYPEGHRKLKVTVSSLESKKHSRSSKIRIYIDGNSELPLDGMLDEYRTDDVSSRDTRFYHRTTVSSAEVVRNPKLFNEEYLENITRVAKLIQDRRVKPITYTDRDIFCI